MKSWRNKFTGKWISEDSQISFTLNINADIHIDNDINNEKFEWFCLAPNIMMIIFFNDYTAYKLVEGLLCQIDSKGTGINCVFHKLTQEQGF